MGIFSRLNTVIGSYINDFERSRNFSRKAGGYRTTGDPDIDSAFEELNDFLYGKEKTSGFDDFEREQKKRYSPPPENLRADFAELDVEFGASAEECKAAYKKLLKIHHPDRHVKNDGNLKKATDKAARINTAYDRIEKWRSLNK